MYVRALCNYKALINARSEVDTSLQRAIEWLNQWVVDDAVCGHWYKCTFWQGVKSHTASWYRSGQPCSIKLVQHSISVLVFEL